MVLELVIILVLMGLLTLKNTDRETILIALKQLPKDTIRSQELIKKYEKNTLPEFIIVGLALTRLNTKKALELRDKLQSNYVNCSTTRTTC